MIVDTNRLTTPQLSCLRDSGVTGVIRYYARSTSQPEKRLTRAEAEALVAASMSIAVVHQVSGNKPSDFSAAAGEADARYALAYAIDTIGQPAGSAIYFAIDYDCSDDDLTNAILPHFRAIKAVNDSGAFSKRYVIGAYGSGLALRRLVEADLVGFAWLSQSTGFREYQTFLDSNRWVLRQGPEQTLCGLGIDEDSPNPSNPGYGAFSTLDSVASA